MKRKLPPELEAKIAEVRMWLFDGDNKRIAKKAKMTREWVSLVLNGHGFNARIIEAAIEVMNENKAKFQIEKKTFDARTDL